MSHDNLVSFDPEHLDAWALLPWFCNRTLSTIERSRIAQHLSRCLVCRREVAMLEVLAKYTVTPKAGDECEAALRRLSLRLDRAPPRPRQIPWAAAAALALCTSLLAWASDNAATSTAWLRYAGYSMASAPAAQEIEAPLGPQFNLVFYDDVTERELRSLVLAVDAVVVEGPTARGVYTLAFSRQMSPGEVMAALRQLRYSRSVLVAEPAVTTKVSDTDW